MRPLSSIKLFFGLFILWAILYFGVMVILDPLKILHKPWFFSDCLQENMREQAAGLIKTRSFDSVILGTSMLENTSASEASQKLGGTFLNLSIAGSDFVERGIVLNALLAEKPIKTVIYSLDDRGLVEPRRGDESYPIEEWSYLYDGKRWSDFFWAYTSTDYLMSLITTGVIGHKANFDRPNAWYTQKEHQERFGGLDRWFKAQNNNQVKAAFMTIASTIRHIRHHEVKAVTPATSAKIRQSQHYFDETILSFAHQSPQTQFILILPPYARMTYAMEAQYDQERFAIYCAMIRYIVEKSSFYPNISLYGWGNESFVDDIRMYKDPTHYHVSINSFMLDAISQQKGRLTAHNVETYLSTFGEKSRHYDLFSLGASIDAYLSHHHYLSKN